MREDIKEKLKADFEVKPDEEIAFVYYQKGETQAKLRFKEENAAVKVTEKMGKADKIVIKDAEVTFKLLEGEEEEAFLKQCLADIKERQRNQSQRKGHKRKSFGRGGGSGNKRARN